MGRKYAAIPVEIPWLITSATPMPIERMRVGISSDKANQTQTPGPSAKQMMNSISEAITR